MRVVLSEPLVVNAVVQEAPGMSTRISEVGEVQAVLRTVDELRTNLREVD